MVLLCSFMRGRSPRILIVDDELGIRKLLSAVFTRAGYTVRNASNGPEAVAVCQDETFDVVLSDVRMPGGMNGHEVVRWVVTKSPDTRTVLMSGYDDIACQHCGVAKYPCRLLPKPFNPKQAVALIDGILDHSPVPTVCVP
jgi:DNA-binding NtrC family response regulator